MLPDLPRVLNKREANWTTTVFRDWLIKNYNTLGGSVFEVKHTRGKNYLNFKEVKERQRSKMLKIRHDKYVWKNPDTGEETPPDIFFFYKAPTYIVIKFKAGVCIIPIDTFLLAEKRSKRKSLIYEEGKKLSTIEF